MYTSESFKCSLKRYQYEKIIKKNLESMDPETKYPKRTHKSLIDIESEQSPPKKRKSKQNGHNPWSLQENLIYATCLLELNQHFSSQFVRRSRRVFRTISAYLTKRTPEQCRSHHQKMLKSYKSFQGIYEHFMKLSLEKGIKIPQKIVDCESLKADQGSGKDNSSGDNHQYSASSQEKNQNENQPEEEGQEKVWDDVFSF